jgi:hypothetical protein
MPGKNRASLFAFPLLFDILIIYNRVFVFRATKIPFRKQPVAFYINDLQKWTPTINVKTDREIACSKRRFRKGGSFMRQKPVSFLIAAVLLLISFGGCTPGKDLPGSSLPENSSESSLSQENSSSSPAESPSSSDYPSSGVSQGSSQLPSQSTNREESAVKVLKTVDGCEWGKWIPYYLYNGKNEKKDVLVRAIYSDNSNAVLNEVAKIDVEKAEENLAGQKTKWIKCTLRIQLNPNPNLDDLSSHFSIGFGRYGMVMLRMACKGYLTNPVNSSIFSEEIYAIGSTSFLPSRQEGVPSYYQVVVYACIPVTAKTFIFYIDRSKNAEETPLSSDDILCWKFL